ncbi:hypothetical protein LCGC14_2825720, partial [marine sediment metagenome]
MKWSDVTADERYIGASSKDQLQIRTDWYENVIKADVRYKPMDDYKIKKALFGFGEEIKEWKPTVMERLFMSETVERDESPIEQWAREGFPLSISDEPPRKIKSKVPKPLMDVVRKYNEWYKSPESNAFHALEDTINVGIIAAGVTVLGAQALGALAQSPMGIKVAQKVTGSPLFQKMMGVQVSPQEVTSTLRKAA